jgi:exodeoxyribonuclease V alpha subunit
MPPPAPPRAPATESLAGVLERIIFLNEESHFTIGELKIEASTGPNAAQPGATATVAGALPGIQCGETLELTGAWVMHPEHGWRFKIATFRSKLPSSIHGIRKYLGSGLVPGIGKTYAEKIVARFGEKTLEVISNQSARLREVPGIGARRATEIKKAWDEQSTLREVMIFLQTHGVTTGLCLRIVREYGVFAKMLLESEPYKIANEIEGIGFRTADRIARNLGLPTEGAARLEAGVLFAVGELEEEGNTAVPRAVLVPRAAAMLEVPPEKIQATLNALVEKNRLLSVLPSGAGDFAGGTGDSPVFADAGSPPPLSALQDWPTADNPTDNPAAPPAASFPAPAPADWLQTPKQARAEEEIAACVSRLPAHPGNFPPIAVDRALSWAQDKAGFAFAPAQAEGVRTALTRKFSILTGGPGTGKTSILAALCAILTAKKARIVLAAPTGRAAQRMGETTHLPASTIHRLLKHDPAQGRFLHDANNPISADLLVVDEASMLDNRLAAALLRAVHNRTHLLLVGDVNQLPSVGPGNVLKDLIASRRVPVTTLSAIFRQGARSRIVATAHDILHGNAAPPPSPPASAPVFAADAEIQLLPAATPEACVAKIVELCRDALPALGLDPFRDVQVLVPMHKGAAGVQAVNAALQQALKAGRGPVRGVAAGGGVRIEEGDKVIQTRNNYDKGVFNGDLGRVAAANPETGAVTVDFDGTRVDYERADLDELHLAYAITIHKSQGSEFNTVVIPILKSHFVMLQRNLIYTAVTRGRKRVVLVGDPAAYGMAVRNSESAARLTLLPERLRE